MRVRTNEGFGDDVRTSVVLVRSSCHRKEVVRSDLFRIETGIRESG